MEQGAKDFTQLDNTALLELWQAQGSSGDAGSAALLCAELERRGLMPVPKKEYDERALLKTGSKMVRAGKRRADIHDAYIREHGLTASESATVLEKLKRQGNLTKIGGLVWVVALAVRLMTTWMHYKRDGRVTVWDMLLLAAFGFIAVSFSFLGLKYHRAFRE